MEAPVPDLVFWPVPEGVGRGREGGGALAATTARVDAANRVWECGLGRHGAKRASPVGGDLGRARGIKTPRIALHHSPRWLRIRDFAYFFFSRVLIVKIEIQLQEHNSILVTKLGLSTRF